jgi:hypothetical protein
MILIEGDKIHDCCVRSSCSEALDSLASYLSIDGSEVGAMGSCSQAPCATEENVRRGYQEQVKSDDMDNMCNLKRETLEELLRDVALASISFRLMVHMHAGCRDPGSNSSAPLWLVPVAGASKFHRHSRTCFQ